MRADEARYYTGEKAEYVREMFGAIARRYDFINTVLSFNRHQAWRRYAVRLARLRDGDSALDVCTGTGAFAFELSDVVGPRGMVAASDFCRPMMEVAKAKVGKRTVSWQAADALALPYGSDKFDAVTVGFGIRNVSNAQRALDEMARVAKPEGRVVCLEFNQPRNRFWRPVVAMFEERIIPLVGGLLSRREAYTYLQKSIKAFYSREELTTMMERAGLRDVRVTDLHFGSVCIHIGTKA